MGQRVLGELGQGAGGLLHHVVGGGFTLGHHGAGEVGDGAEEFVALLFGLRELLGDDALGFLQGAHLRARLGGLLLLALLHQGADRGGDAVELGSLVVVFKLQLAATVVEGYYAGDRLGAVETFDGQACHHLFGVCFYLLECKHTCLILRILRRFTTEVPSRWRRWRALRPARRAPWRPHPSPCPSPWGMKRRCGL